VVAARWFQPPLILTPVNDFLVGGLSFSLEITPMAQNLDQWTEKDFLRRAYINALDHSDDPSTQNGAVLVPAGSKANLVVYGANRFPTGVAVKPERLADRDTKLSFMVHAERDAIFRAALLGYPTHDATLYVPWFACAGCAQAIIVAGIRRVVGHWPMMCKTPNRWVEAIRNADEMLDEAGVERDYINEPLFDDDPVYQVLFNGEYWIP
jgi:dCMP deaminase